MSFYRRQPKQQPRINVKVKFLVSIAGGGMPAYEISDFSFAPGSIQELDSELASKWIDSGIAELAP